jgi:hypothetical protein
MGVRGRQRQLLKDLGCMVVKGLGLGFGVWDMGLEVRSFEFGAWGLGFRVLGLG